MNIADTLRGLARRWYVVVPGLVLAVAVAVGAFFVIKPGYERTATQLLTPGTGIVPEGTTNPYLFLGGLTPATDILIRAINSDEVVGELAESYPGIEIEVKKDPTQSGPVLLLTVTARSDQDAGTALTELLAASTATLERLQVEQDVSRSDRINISTLTEDPASTPQQRTRLVVAAGAGLALIVLTLLVASLVDGMTRKVRPKGRMGERASTAPVASPVLDDTDEIELMEIAATEGKDWDPIKMPPDGYEADVDAAQPPTDPAPGLREPRRRKTTPVATSQPSD